MADIIDEANDRAQRFLEKALANVPKPKKLVGIGLCLNCGEAINDERRFCDVACRDEYDHVNRRRDANRK